jgi:hypothetical protein
MDIGNRLTNGANGKSKKEIVVNLDYILDKKPSIKTVREFMKANLDSIKSEEEVMFTK